MSSFDEPENDVLIDEEDTAFKDTAFVVDHKTIRAKWVMDGASTLREAVTALLVYAEQLAQLERDGWQLTQPVEDDYGFIKQVAATGASSPPGERR